MDTFSTKGVCTLSATAALRVVTMVRQRTPKCLATSGVHTSSRMRRERGCCSDRTFWRRSRAASRLPGWDNCCPFSSNRTIRFCIRVRSLDSSSLPLASAICPTVSQLTPPGNASLRRAESRTASAARTVFPKPAIPWTTSQPSLFPRVRR